MSFSAFPEYEHVLISYFYPKNTISQMVIGMFSLLHAKKYPLNITYTYVYVRLPSITTLSRTHSVPVISRKYSKCTAKGALSMKIISNKLQFIESFFYDGTLEVS